MRVEHKHGRLSMGGVLNAEGEEEGRERARKRKQDLQMAELTMGVDHLCCLLTHWSLFFLH